MKHEHLQPIPQEIEAFLAVERELVPEPDEIRRREVERARASLRLNLWLGDPRGTANSRRVTFRWAMAAMVTLSALSAAAFFAGYGFRGHSSAALSSAPVAAPADASPALPVTPLVSDAVTPAEPSLIEPRSAKPKPAGSAKSASESEIYAIEVQVLQPARQAVARQDFASALAAIAAHQRRFPSGKLTEEREAMRVKALLGLGRIAEAQSAGSAFRVRFPRSALLRRIDVMLESGK
jgi:hypothetical protein